MHSYEIRTTWTGNRGVGTADYRAYDRAHEIVAPGKPPLAGSSDPSFRGDATRWNPEELLVASLSACHMLWYLHLCADAGILVTAYQDDARGAMQTTSDGGGRFTEVAAEAGVGMNDDGRALSSMGVDFRDIDNDGRPDLFVTALANETYPLFRNLGRGLFLDATYPSKIGAATLPWSGWSTAPCPANRAKRRRSWSSSSSATTRRPRSAGR